MVLIRALVIKRLLVTILISLSASLTWASKDQLLDFYKSLSIDKRSIFKQYIDEQGWIHFDDTEEFRFFMNYENVKSISHDVTEVWVKSIVMKDLTKDSLRLKDYTMEHYSFNCSKRTFKQLSYVNYDHKKNSVINFKNYNSPLAVSIVPETISERMLTYACFMNYMKLN